MENTKSYWESRYINNQTDWDAGAITTPLKEYFDQLTDKSIKILIPGAGNGYEAAYLFENGFKNIFVIDIAQQPKEQFFKVNPEFPKQNWIFDDFFNHVGEYDLIVEQTFFCAIPPIQRQQYAEKVHQLLKPNGKLIGVLFDCEFDGGPPFSGSKIEYVKYFEPLFRLLSFEPCYNSIKPRINRELFIQLQKK